MFRNKLAAADWLSGIIDGEGSVSMRPVRGTRGFVREVRITNTDHLLLDAVEAALDLLNVPWVEYDRSERERLGTKPIFDVVISGKANLETLGKVVTLHGEKAAKMEEMLGSYIRGRGPTAEVLAKLVARGKSDAEIAVSYGVTPGAVWAWRKKYGLDRPTAVA